MSIGVLLVTHPGIGEALLNNASELIGACPLQVRCMDIPLQCDTAQLQQTVLENARKLDDGSGVLILTDAFGATPSNIACQLTRKCWPMWCPASTCPCSSGFSTTPAMICRH